MTFTTIEAAPEGWRTGRTEYEVSVLAHARGLVIGQAFDITLTEDVDKAVGRVANALRKSTQRFAFRRRSVSTSGTVYRIHRIG